MINPSAVKVSVMMVTYNHMAFLAQAIESVMQQQTDFEFELVIGEDCSTDGTRALAQAFQTRYPDRIRLLLTETNLGMHLNTLHTYAACRGEYVALLDGDDYWTATDKLQQQVDLLDQHPEWAICFHNAEALHLDGGQAPTLLVSPTQKTVSTLEDLLAGNFIPSCSAMFRRQNLPNFPDWYQSMKLLDWMMLSLNARHGLIGYLPQTMAAYHVHSRGMWNSMNALPRYQEVDKLYRHLYQELGPDHAARLTIHAADNLQYFARHDFLPRQTDPLARQTLQVSLASGLGALGDYQWNAARRGFSSALTLATSPCPPADFSAEVLEVLRWLFQATDQWARLVSGPFGGPTLAPVAEPAALSRPLRILHTVEAYAPHVGGCETVVQQLSEYMARRGHSVTVVTGYDPDRRFTELNGVRVEQFQLSGKVCLGLHGPRGELERYQNFVRGGNFDVILNYMVEAWTTDLVLPLLPKLRGVKVVFPLGLLNRENTAAPWRQFYAALPDQLRHYDHVIYNSPSSPEKAYGDALGLPRVSILPNGASQAEFDGPMLDFRARHDIRTPHLLLSAATYNNGKRFEFVTRAFRAMGRDDTTLVISGVVPWFAGRGWQADQLAVERMASWVTPNLRVLEGTPREWLVSGMRAADLFLFGSAFEASPVVIHEALAAGTPFVTTDVGNVSDYVCGGEIVNTPAEMAAAADRLLDAPKQRARYSAAGRDFWRAHLTWEAIGAQLEHLYGQPG